MPQGRRRNQPASQPPLEGAGRLRRCGAGKERLGNEGCLLGVVGHEAPPAKKVKAIDGAVLRGARGALPLKGEAERIPNGSPEERTDESIAPKVMFI